MRTRIAKTQTGNAAVYILLGITVAVVTGVGWGVAIHHNSSNKAKASIQNPAAGSTVKTGNGSALGSSTDNNSLNNDLGGINASLSQEAQDANSAAAGINDQQSEITVPTN